MVRNMNVVMNSNNGESVRYLYENGTYWYVVADIQRAIEAKAKASIVVGNLPECDKRKIEIYTNRMPYWFVSTNGVREMLKYSVLPYSANFVDFVNNKEKQKNGSDKDIPWVKAYLLDLVNEMTDEEDMKAMLRIGQAYLDGKKKSKKYS